MKKSPWFWIGLMCLGGIVMAFPAVQSTFFFKGTLMMMKVTQGLRFLADSVFLLDFLLFTTAIGASLCFLIGTAAAVIGRLRMGLRIFMFGTICQWLFFAAAFILPLKVVDPNATGYGSLVIYCAVTLIVSVATLQLRRRFQATVSS